PLMALSSSPDAACRAAGLACLHGLCVYGSQGVREVLGGRGAVVDLVDAVKLEGVALPDCLQPPLCEPNCSSRAAAEALAALASASEALRRDVGMQLCALLRSSNTALAASACNALKTLSEELPAATSTLTTQGIMPPLVSHIACKPASTPASQPQRASQHSDQGGAAQGGLQQRAVQLLWVLCRGGGEAVDAAVAAGAAEALLQRLGSVQEVSARVAAAAALGPLLKKSAAARDAVSSQGGLGVLLELPRQASVGMPLCEEALGALAVLAALHAPCRVEAARALRQMLVR
ncbi:hypothetical protein Agub_g9983, partial [Astrephomene gubernaculifera]